MKPYRQMMIDRDGHWWNKEKTIGWYVRKSKKEHCWIGAIILNERKLIICRKSDRGQAMKQAVKALRNKLN
jgi:hypothetical protein